MKRSAGKPWEHRLGQVHHAANEGMDAQEGWEEGPLCWALLRGKTSRTGERGGYAEVIQMWWNCICALNTKYEAGDFFCSDPHWRAQRDFWSVSVPTVTCHKTPVAWQDLIQSHDFVKEQKMGKKKKNPWWEIMIFKEFFTLHSFEHQWEFMHMHQRLRRPESIN